MSDWENESNEEEEKNEVETKEEVKNIKHDFEDESESITVTKQKPVGTIKQKNKPIDYEKKYNERNKDNIEIQNEIEEAVKNIKDPELQVKKRLEYQHLVQGENFLGESKSKIKKTEEKEINLETEKDFIKLAQSSAAKINSANKLPSFTLSYLKNSIELLGPTLESEQLKDLTDAINIIFNKKIKEERGSKNKKNKKPQIKAGKMMEKIEKSGLYEEYKDDDNQGGNEEKEEEYNEDDFM